MASDEDLLIPAGNACEDEEEIHRHPQPLIPRSFKMTKTVCMISIWMFVGLSGSVITPSVDDLIRQVDCNYEELTYALAARGVGTIMGAVLFGILNEKFKGYTDIFISVELLLGGCCIALIPWTHKLVLVGVALFSVGFANGGLSASGNSHVVFMWGEKSAGPVHLVHFGFGLANVIGPLLAGAFISKPINPAIGDLNEFAIAFENNFYASLPPSQNFTESRIYIPFGICGGFSFISSMIFIVFFFMPLNKLLYHSNTQSRTQVQAPSQETTQPFLELLNPGSCAGGNVIYGVAMFGLLLLLYILIVSKDSLVVTYIYPIAVDTSLAFTPWQGVLLATMYNACYAISRLVFAVIGHLAGIQITIFIEMVIALAAGTALAVIGLNSHVTFWVTICAFGFSAGPVYPSGMAFIDRYLKMTPAAFSILDIGIGIGALISTWLTGYIFQHRSPQDLFYLSLGCAVGITLLLTVMQILGKTQGDRYDRARQEILRDNVVINVNSEVDDEPLLLPQ